MSIRHCCLHLATLVLTATLIFSATAGAQKKKDQTSYEVTVRVADKPVANLSLRLVSDVDSSAPALTNQEGVAVLAAPAGHYQLFTPEPVRHRGWMLWWNVPVELKGGVFAKLQNRKKLTEDEALFADSLPSALQSSVVNVYGALGAGTGLLLTGTGIVVTSHELVDDVIAPLVQVDLVTKVRARFLGADSGGVAFLKVSSRSCEGCKPVARTNSATTWKKGDIVRLTRRNPVLGLEDAAVVIERTDTLEARTDHTPMWGLLGAPALDTAGSIVGLVVRDRRFRVLTDTGDNPESRLHHYTIQPMSRVWKYLPTLDAGDVAVVADTLFPELDFSNSTAWHLNLVPPAGKAPKDISTKSGNTWALNDSSGSWAVSILARQALGRLRGDTESVWDMGDPVRSAALRRGLREWWSWRAYAETGAPVVMVAVSPRLNRDLFSAQVTDIMRGKKDKGYWCGYSYKSSIADVELQRDGIASLPLERARVRVAEHIPGSTGCVPNPREKQVMQLYPTSAFAPRADGSWPTLTVQAYDDKKDVWKSVTIDVKSLEQIWRDISAR